MSQPAGNDPPAQQQPPPPPPPQQGGDDDEVTLEEVRELIRDEIGAALRGGSSGRGSSGPAPAGDIAGQVRAEVDRIRAAERRAGEKKTNAEKDAKITELEKALAAATGKAGGSPPSGDGGKAPEPPKVFRWITEHMWGDPKP